MQQFLNIIQLWFSKMYSNTKEICPFILAQLKSRLTIEGIWQDIQLLQTFYLHVEIFFYLLTQRTLTYIYLYIYIYVPQS